MTDFNKRIKRAVSKRVFGRGRMKPPIKIVKKKNTVPEHKQSDIDKMERKIRERRG